MADEFWDNQPEPDREEYVGDEDDGCYVQLFEYADGYHVRVLVDSCTGNFADVLTTFSRPSLADALRDGMYAAANWCSENAVSFEHEFFN
ncbi:MAG: hypothetical protein R3322_00435 [Kiloniellales bacterium]|nr:hypothetical protein [Kiloniellales bacterium]